jgi:mono/diheme cytochrome c family protein
LNRQPPQLSRADTAELVRHLSDATGWWRLTAQRLLVERRDPAVTPLLSELARRGPNPLGRLHALWTLDGLGALTADIKLAAVADSDERVRAAALRLCESGLDARQQATLITRLAETANDASEAVRLQGTLTASGLTSPAALPVLARLARSGTDPLFATAAFTGLQDRELDFLRLLLAASRERPSLGAHEDRLCELAVHCILEAADAERTSALFDAVAGAGGPGQWQQAVLLDAMSAFITGPRRTRTGPIALAREPMVLLKLARGPDLALRQRAYRLLDLFTWPGAQHAVVDNEVAALAPAQQRRIESGREVFTNFCAPCHQPNGIGAAGVAPPLAGSDWVSGPPERLARIVLHGLYGPVSVNQQTWNLAMPGLGAAGALDDEKIAAVLSYVRRAWGNTVSIVEPSLVATIRRDTSVRTLPWTAEELGSVAGTGPTSVAVAAITPGPNGEILLPARQAKVYAQRLGYRPALDVLAPWTVGDDVAEWRVQVAVGGVFDVAVNLAADDDSAGDFFVVETEGSRTRGEVPSTGDYDHFREQPAGRLTLRAGLNRIILRPDGPLKRELADVRGMRLIPVRTP